MNVLKMYDERLKHMKNDCTTCSHHVTRHGTTQEIHFCEVSGKILLFPLYIPNNCKKFERRCDTKMSVNSKQKGARFERLLASKFREYGYSDSRRTAQYCGNTGQAEDVIGLKYIHAEAKNQEQMRLYEWIDQSKRDASAGEEGKLPVVFHKKNNHEILASMPLDVFMELYREYEASMSLKEGGRK